MSSAISMRDVSMTFGNGVQALADLSLEIAEGERVALIGPSGCGKSTALRLIAALEQPTSGAVNVNCKPGALSFVFQTSNLLPWATVRDNVWLPLRLRGRSRSQSNDKIDAALEQVGLLEFASAWPRELSGGMAMRVSLARALITQPQILLLDEPFAALDDITRFALNDLLLDLHDRIRFSMLFVTHSVFEAAYLNQRVLVMGDRPGTIIARIETPGKGADYRASPLYHEHTETLFGHLRSRS